MLSREEIITRILAQRSDLSREEIQRLTQKKRDEAGQLLTDEGALYMVANELGINIADKNSPNTRILVKDVMAGANDVSIIGTVTSVSPVQVFKRANGAEGRVARFTLADETGLITVVLWDEKTAILSQEKLLPNQEVNVLHGYVKEGLNGKPELNVGRRGMVNVLSTKPVTTLPGGTEHFKKIHDLSEADYSVNLVGIAKGISPVSVFERQNGKSGQVMRIWLEDGSGGINIVVWDDNVEAVKKTKKNDYVEVSSGQVRKGMRDVLEVHVGKQGKITAQSKKPSGVDIPTVTLTKIGELQSGMMSVDVLGRVTDIGQIREFMRPSGEVGRVADLYLQDDSGSIRLSLWDDKADVLKNITAGSVVLVEAAYAREGSFGIGLNLGKMGSLTVNPDIKEAKTLPVLSEVTSIDQLKAGMASVNVQGTIVDAPNVRTVTTRDGQEVTVASFRLRDKTGEVQVSLWRELADKLQNLPPGTGLKLKNLYTRTAFDGGMELSSRSTAEIEVLSQPDDNAGASDNTSLDELTESKENPLEDEEEAHVTGKILELAAKVYSVCPTCNKKLQEDEGEWICERCGLINQPVHKLTVHASLEDSSGKITAVFRDSLAEKLLGMTADKAWSIAEKTGKEDLPLDAAGKKLIGKNINVSGKISVEQASGNLRLLVETIN